MADLHIPLAPFQDIYDSNHDWGGELRFINEPPATEIPSEDRGYCAKFLYLGNNLPSSLHYHKNKKETFMVMFGKVQIKLVSDGGTETMEVLNPGEKLTLEPGMKHQFQSIDPTGRSLILEASTYHEDSDTYRN